MNVRIYNLSETPKAGGWHAPLVLFDAEHPASSDTEVAVRLAVQQAELPAGDYTLLIQWLDGEVAIERVTVTVPPPTTRSVRGRRIMGAGLLA